MAVGDIKSAMITGITAGSTVNIRPFTAGEEWIIHNIYYDNAVEFYINCGDTMFKFDFDTTYGAKLCYVFHVSQSQYLTIKNTSGTTINIAYDGVQSK